MNLNIPSIIFIFPVQFEIHNKAILRFLVILKICHYSIFTYTLSVSFDCINKIITTTFRSKIHEMKFGFAWIILLTYNRKAWSNRGFYRMWPIEIWQQCLDFLVSPCHFLFFHAIKYSTYKSIKRKIFAFRWYLNVYIWNSNLSLLENVEISRNIVLYICPTVVYE